jgi:regulator of sirC expression with transglutaminase-like and TPR domain
MAVQFDEGKVWNLEPTSGAGVTRDIWYRQKLEMTDKAIANGAYLKSLSRREAVVVIATALLDHLMRSGDFEDAVAVADVLIEAWPKYAYAHVKKGTAYYRMLELEFIRRYPEESDIPAEELGRAQALYRANQAAFAKAEALGWIVPELK